jgi:hypothetical protein
MGTLGVSELPLLVLLFLLFVTPLLAIVSALLFAKDVWLRAGYSANAKLVWVGICFVLGPIGSLGYFVGIWPKLLAHRRHNRA